MLSLLFTATLIIHSIYNVQKHALLTLFIFSKVLMDFWCWVNSFLNFKGNNTLQIWEENYLFCIGIAAWNSPMSSSTKKKAMCCIPLIDFYCSEGECPLAFFKSNATLYCFNHLQLYLHCSWNPAILSSATRLLLVLVIKTKINIEKGLHTYLHTLHTCTV